MRRIALSVLRRKAQDAIGVLEAAGEKVDRYCEFLYCPDEHQELEIAREDFFSEEAPPGVYRFKVKAPDGTVIGEGEGCYLSIRSDKEEKAPDAAQAHARSVSVLLHESSADVQLSRRRAREAEQHEQDLRDLCRSLEGQLRDRDRKIAELEQALEAAGDDELSEFAELLGNIAIKVFGLDPSAPVSEQGDQAEAVEVVIEAVRQSPAAQAAVQQLVGPERMRRLGMGREP